MTANTRNRESRRRMMVGRLLLMAVCFVGSIGGAQAWAEQAQTAGTITDAFLAKNGQAEAVIVVGKESGAVLNP